MTVSNKDWVYHVTFARNLESIKEHGLNPDYQTGLSALAYIGHSKGKTFFTEFKSIRHWYFEAEQGAENQSDNILESGFVPVVLTFPKPENVFEDEAMVDEIHSAYYTTDMVPSEQILVWDGDIWVNLENVDNINLVQAIEFDYDEGERLCYIKAQNINPLVNVLDANKMCG